MAFLGCCRQADGTFGVAGLSPNLELLGVIALPNRGHDIAVSPDGAQAVVLARRPGRFALVLDLDPLAQQQELRAAPGRHFFGHGFYAADGKHFFTTENDFERPGSVLGVYDVTAGFLRIGEVDTGGIGAHEALLLRDGETIVVANGGIETHPDFPRRKLNLSSMRPSLSYLRASDGQLLEQCSAPTRWHQLSLRHLTQTADGEVWIGGQFEGSGSSPALLRHRRGEALDIVDDLDSELAGRLGGYVGSVSAAANGEMVVATSPRRNRALALEARTGRLVRSVQIADVCGAAANPGVLLSAGTGSVRSIGGHERSFPLAWDNHLVGVRPSPSG
ncbi:MAG: DUF1513 domain-containing protein [Pseudomonadota bacterium]